MVLDLVMILPFALLAVLLKRAPVVDVTRGFYVFLVYSVEHPDAHQNAYRKAAQYNGVF